MHLEEGTWQPPVVQSREFGPVRIGSAAFSGRKTSGSWRAGAKVKTSNSQQVWCVLNVFADGRLHLRSGMNKCVVKPDVVASEETFDVNIFSIDGQAFRITEERQKQ